MRAASRADLPQPSPLPTRPCTRYRPRRPLPPAAVPPPLRFERRLWTPSILSTWQMIMMMALEALNLDSKLRQFRGFFG